MLLFPDVDSVAVEVQPHPPDHKRRSNNVKRYQNHQAADIEIVVAVGRGAE